LTFHMPWRKRWYWSLRGASAKRVCSTYTGICLAYAWHMPDICLRARHIAGIFLAYCAAILSLLSLVAGIC